jgi:hypothetical protein
MLRDAMDFFERQAARDVFLTGALPVVASLISSRIEIPHLDGTYYPDLYACVVAPPASGKGALKWARRLAEVTNDRLRSESERRRAAWHEQDPDDREGPEPPLRSLILSGNSSSAALIENLEANGEGGLVFEEEIDAMTTAMKQDWGGFSQTLRKAFHHDTVTADRKNERFWIKRPRLSMVLSGTHDQFLDLFEDAANGLFSRYGFYYFEDYSGWRSHRPRRFSTDRPAYFREQSDRLDQLRLRLGRRSEPLRVALTPDQWDRHDETHAGHQKKIRAQSLPMTLISNVRRAGIITCRLAAILRVVRALDQGEDLTAPDRLRCTDEDVEVALWMGSIFVDHAIRMFGLLEDADLTPKGERLRKAFDLLPTRFERDDLLDVASEIGVSESTIYNYRSDMLESGMIAPTEGGTYQKAGTPPNGAEE